jgi:hypothetical protein
LNEADLDWMLSVPHLGPDKPLSSWLEKRPDVDGHVFGPLLPTEGAICGDDRIAERIPPDGLGSIRVIEPGVEVIGVLSGVWSEDAPTLIETDGVEVRTEDRNQLGLELSAGEVPDEDPQQGEHKEGAYEHATYVVGLEPLLQSCQRTHPSSSFFGAGMGYPFFRPTR